MIHARFLAAAVVLLTTAAAAGTIDNDDSCDIALLPAATLLLPYFEVDITSARGTGETTIFTVTNTGRLPQVARVTLWTDLGYPVFTFNLPLAGYDVQSINLYDVIVRGSIDGPGCDGVPVQLDRAFTARMQSAFTIGKVPSAGELSGCNTAGQEHPNAAGYATIDVVGRCGMTMPHEDAYFASDIRFDNVLMGDYHQVNGDEEFAQGGSMVHIRAIPEGGTPETRAGDSRFQVNVPRTFYSGQQHPLLRNLDARQPLPSLFAARWIEGGASGFETFFKIWREGNGRTDSCAAYPRNNEALREVVRFDEDENPEILMCNLTILCIPIYSYMPLTSARNTWRDGYLPPNSQEAIGGWMYLNLDTRTRDDHARQAWVVVSMRAEDRFSSDFHAVALGNGCSAPITESQAYSGTLPIGPAPNGR